MSARTNSSSQISSGETRRPKPNKEEKGHHQGPQIIIPPHDWFGPISRAEPQKRPKIQGVPDDVEPWAERRPHEEEIDDRVSFGVLKPGQSRPIIKKTPLASEIPQRDHSDDGEPSFGLKRRKESSTRVDPALPLPPEKQSYTQWFGVPKQHPVHEPQNSRQPEGLFGLRQHREPPAHLYPQRDSIPLNQKSSQPILPPSLPLVHPTHLSQQADGSHLPTTERHFDEVLNLNPPREFRGQTGPDSNQPTVKARSEVGKPDKYVIPNSTKPRWSRWLSDGAFGLKRVHQQLQVHFMDPSSPARERVEDENIPSHSAYRNYRDVPTKLLGPPSGDEVGRRRSHSSCDSPVDTPLEDKRVWEARIEHPEPSGQPTSQLADELLRFIRSRTTKKAGGKPGGMTKQVSEMATTSTDYSLEMASLKQSYRFDPPSKPVRKLGDSTQDLITVLEKEASIEQYDLFVGQPLMHESPKTFQSRSASFRSLRPYTERKGLSTSLRLTSQVPLERVPRKRQVLSPIRPRSMIIRRPSFFSDTLRQSRGTISDQVANQKKSLRQRPTLLAAHRLRQLRNAVSAMTDKDKNTLVLSPALVRWPNGPDQSNDT